MIELPDHAWYIGCQFHPELKSRPTRPHPLFAGFIGAALKRPGAGEWRVAGPQDHGGSRALSGWSFSRAPFVIAGPCVVEPGDLLPRVAEVLAQYAERRGVPVCFKASFDKANRSRLAPRAARAPTRGCACWSGSGKGAGCRC